MNVFLEATRRGEGAELAERVDEDGGSFRDVCSIDAGDIGGVVGATERSVVTDTNNETIMSAAPATYI
jgi:hypothetical protein